MAGIRRQRIRNGMENNKVKLKIVFAGTPDFGATILEKLIQSEYAPALVITAPDKPVGRKQILTPPPVKVLAQKNKIAVIQPEKIRNLELEIRNLRPDLIILAAYGKILSKHILDIPRYGSLNVHPSLLPKFRGPSPIQSAILSGDKKTGVTIMLMNEKLDEGDIVSFKDYPLSGSETYETLHNALAETGADLLIKTMPDWISGKIKAVPQDNTKATYTKILKKEDGKIDWSKPANFIERQIRAYNPWPGTFDVYNEKILKILKAEVVNERLIIKQVQPEGKKPMDFNDFLLGHKDYNR